MPFAREMFARLETDQISKLRGTALTLHAGKRCYFDKISSAAQLSANLSVHFIPRTPLSHFADLGEGDLFDIEASVAPGDSSRALVCIDARTETLDTSAPSHSHTDRSIWHTVTSQGLSDLVLYSFKFGLIQFKGCNSRDKGD